MSVGGAASGGPDTVEDMELDANKNEKMFTLKKWNAVAMWSWDVECDTCAICRVQVMGENSFPF
jgi:RING-box protein 2